MSTDLLTFRPDVTAWRAQLQPRAARRHPGKLHLEFLRWLADRYVRPGHRVFDPMAGSGTALVLTLPPWGCAVTVNEYEARWVAEIEATWAHLQGSLIPPAGTATVRCGDAQMLPATLGPFDVILFSPPYADALNTQRHTGDARELRYGGGGVEGRIALRHSYGPAPRGKRDPNQIGHLRGKRYTAAMAAVYSGCAGVLAPGGHMIVVLRNIIREHREVDLIGEARTLCEATGLRYETTHWRAVPLGAYQAVRRKTDPTAIIIDREAALVFTRPEVL